MGIGQKSASSFYPTLETNISSWLRFFYYELRAFLNQNPVLSFFYQMVLILTGFGFLIILSRGELAFPVIQTVQVMFVWFLLIILFKPPSTSDEPRPFSEELDDILENLN